MSLTYSELTGLNPRAFCDAGDDMSKTVGKLAGEYQQYNSLVVRPLQHKYGWHGGGQPDAAVVAKVNGLAVDTMRLRAAAGALAFMYAYAGFTLAQQQLASLCRRIDNDGMKVDDDGNVSAKGITVGDDGGPGSTSAKVMSYQVDMGRVLKFATIIDDVTAGTLNGSHEPPVTGLTNRPGLLDEARQDHGDATNDAAAILDEFRTLPGTAAENLPLDNDFPGIPGIDIQVPPGQAGNTFGMGLFIMGLFLEGGALGFGMGGQLEIAVPLGLTGAVCLAIGGALVRADGGALPRVSIAGTGMPAGDPATDASLDKLMPQANRLEKEASQGRGPGPFTPRPPEDEAEATRRHRLGEDPDQGGKYSHEEERTALEVEHMRGITLERSERGNGDWYDVNNPKDTYDAMGSTLKSSFFDQQWKHIRGEIRWHLEHKAKYVPFDVSGLTEVQQDRVATWIVNQGLESRVFIVGGS